MDIKTFSRQRGITALCLGHKYIIHSEIYGIVAESTEVKRSDDHNVSDIKFEICKWVGDWDLRSIISRGVKKHERKYIKDRKVNIEYTTIIDQQMMLYRDLVVYTEEY